MTSILEKGENREKCQKFTPESLVNAMLDLLGYNSRLVGKTILENSFGDGRILKAIVKRYINSALSEGYSRSEISISLGNDIYGVELDKSLYQKCLSDLNSIIHNHNIPYVKWKIYNGDALSIDYNTSFDFIIGNPPYISYKEIDRCTRKKLKEKFTSCAIGKYDYCYAFIELGVTLLNDNGKLVQLIPNNIFKNVFGNNLREILKPHISKIIDYPNQKLFDNAMTSISIFLYDKSNNNSEVYYKNETYNTQKIINRKQLKEKWIFDTIIFNEDLIRFGDFFNASITIATLCNKAFIVDNKTIIEEELEKQVLRKTVSPRTLRYNENKQIIFPYTYKQGILCHYNEKIFEKKYPNVVLHLKKYISDLEKRNSDKGILWYEYGRSQALAHLDKEKALLSTIVTSQVEVYLLERFVIPFSGIYITVTNKNYTLHDAIRILKSEDFYQYVKKIGISINGKSYRITCKDINNYTFSRRNL